MLHKVAAASVKNRRTLLIVVAILAAVAGWQSRHVRQDALPEFVPPTVEVQTEALGLSAAETEQLLTVPLERDFLNGVPFVKSISSTSAPGLSSVVLTFEQGTSIFTARQLVQERLTLTTELPRVSKPPQMLEAVSSASRIEMIGLTSKTVSAIDMSVLSRFTIKPRLLGVPGVANVAIFGERDLQLQVQVDPAKLAAKGVTLDDVVATTGNALFVSPLPYLEASTPGAGGFFDTTNQRLGVQHDLPIQGPGDLAKVAVDGAPAGVTLADLGSVVEDHQPLIGDASVGGDAGLYLVVQKLPGADTTKVTKAVDEALDSLRPGLGGITIDTSPYRPARYIDQAVRNLRTVAVVTGLLALLALILVLLDQRTIAAVVVGLPLSLLAGVWALYLTGTDLTAVGLAGLAAGGVIGVRDALAVALAVGSAPAEDAAGAAMDGATAVARPLGLATVATLVALIPVLFLSGLPSHPYLPPMAAAFGLSLVASLVVAVTVVPALLAVLGSGASRRHATQPEPGGRVGRAAGGVVAKVLGRPALGIAAAAVLLVVGIVATTQVSPALSPNLDETDLLVRWKAAPGTSLSEVTRIVNRAQKDLQAVPGVVRVGSHIGRAVSSDQVGDVTSAESWVGIDPKADHGDVLEHLQAAVDAYPGLGHDVVSYYDDQVIDAAGTDEEPIVVRVSGQDFSVLQSKAAEIKGRVAKVKGVSRADVDTPPVQPTIEVDVDLAKAQAAGVKPGDVRRAATTLVSGLTVGALYEGQKVFEVVVRGGVDAAANVNAVKDLRVDGPNGQIRLGDVATVGVGSSPSAIEHNDVSRTVDVDVFVRGRSAHDVLRDVRRSVAGVTFPAEHSARVISQVDATRSSQLRVGLYGLVALVILFLLLQALADSWGAAAVGVVAVPLGVAGAVAGIWALGGVLSLGSVAGLFLIAALTVHEVTALLADRSPLQRAVRVRSAVVVATALPLALACIPVLFLVGRPGGEIMRPMAGAVLGGLVSWVAVTLFVTPAGLDRLGWRGDEVPEPVSVGLPALPAGPDVRLAPAEEHDALEAGAIAVLVAVPEREAEPAVVVDEVAEPETVVEPEPVAEAAPLVAEEVVDVAEVAVEPEPAEAEEPPPPAGPRPVVVTPPPAPQRPRGLTVPSLHQPLQRPTTPPPAGAGDTPGGNR